MHFSRSAFVCEEVEHRVMLAATAPRVTGTVADNRGQIVVAFNQGLNASTLTRRSVGVFAAGRDGRFRTADDVKLTSRFSYAARQRQLTINAPMKANRPYRVLLSGKAIKGSTGLALDGEFNGATLASGNGRAGGSYDVIARLPKSFVARFSTLAGNIDVQLLARAAPRTVGNFLAYANKGAWDGTFFHRSVANFVVQGGGFKVDGNGQPAAIAQNAPVVNEYGISNTRGTMAMAKLGSDPNSATNQWFFNLGNNSSNLDNQNGGFTVFARVLNAAGLAVMDRLAAYPRINAGGTFSELPVRSTEAIAQRGNRLDPNADLIFINRIAVLMAVGAR